MKTLALNLLSFICISAFWLSSCGPGDPDCPDDVTKYASMRQEYKDQLPYNGRSMDTLYYVTNFNETLSFEGTGIQTFFIDEMERNVNPDCNSWTTTKREGYRIVYSGNKDLKVRHGGESSKNITISYDGHEFILTDIVVGNPPTTSSKTYFDSVALNNTTFYKVTRHSGVNVKDTIWVNNKDGVVKMYLHSSDEFLINITRD